MTHPLHWTDRFRIERAVWTLDWRLQDVPRSSRVAKRRELRDNLRDAAGEVGAAEAVRGLGDPRRLAADYLAAEYGDWEPRPSWTAGVAAFVGGYLLLTWLAQTGTSAFRAGVVAADPDATGTFYWGGIPHMLDEVTFEFADGKSTSVGGAWTPLAYATVFAFVVLAGRLWRILPRWRRHDAVVAND